MKRFQGDLVFKAHRCFKHSSLVFTVIKKRRFWRDKGVGIWGLGLEVKSLRIMVWDLRLMAQGLGFRVEGLGMSV